MATSAYYAWVRDGRPFTLIRPCQSLRNILARHGYVVYGVGNDDHLMADTPEDHTPFSATGWPGKAKYGFGYALDIMPPARGAKSKVNGKPLPSLQQLGAQLVKDRKAGHAPIGWLKYINWEPDGDNEGRCWHDSWQPNFARTNSSDRGHIHLSARTGAESSTAGDSYDPVARIFGEDDDMAYDDNAEAVATATTWRALGLLENRESITYTVKGEKRVEKNGVYAALKSLTLKVDALAATPPGSVNISDEQLERVLRKVIGSVDGKTG